MNTSDLIKRLQEIEEQYGVLDIRSFDSVDEAFIDGVDVEIILGQLAPYCFITYSEEGRRFYILD